MGKSEISTDSVPRVLMLVTRNQPRGAERAATLLAAELADRGLGVRLVSLAPGDPGVPELPAPVLGPSTLSLRTLVRLRREMAAADVVVACGSRTLPASLIAGIGLDSALIYQNIGDPLFWAHTWARKARVRAMFRRVAAVAALSQDSATVLSRDFGLPADRVVVLGNARSGEVFRPASEGRRRAARRSIGLPDHGSTALLVAALSPEKRVDLAIAAVGGIAEEVRLVVVGEGPLRVRLEKQAASVAPGRVHFLGARDDMPELYAAADVVMLTSDSEGLPGALIEAGLSGLPAVATDVGYVSEIVLDGVTGYLEPPEDPRALGVGLRAALERRDDLGVAARRHCLENFELSSVGDAWARLVRDVHGGREVHGVRPAV